MPRKKKEEPEILEDGLSQTGTEIPENDVPSGSDMEDLSGDTDFQNGPDTEGDYFAEEGTEGSVQSEDPEFQDGYDTEGIFSPGGESADAVDEEGTESQDGYDTGKEFSQEEMAEDAVGNENPEIQNGHGTETENAPGEPADESADGRIDTGKKERPDRREKTTPAVMDVSAPSERRTRRTAPIRTDRGVLSIDGQLLAETDAEKARNDLLDLLESQKTGRILTGTIQGIEQPGGRGRSLAVIYHGDFKVIIPAEEAVELPDDLRGRTQEEAYHYLLTKRLGAETDYLVKGTDREAGVAVASRLAAMRARRKEYYLGTDREGNYRIHSGVCAEARVVSVIRAGIFVDVFGLEAYIPLRELSYQRWMDAAGYFQTGQRILVKILDVDRSDRNHVKITASVKQAGENPYEKALRRYSVGNRYVGTVSMVDTNGVFVALDGGIDCLCSYPKRGRPPRGSRATVRILGINEESNRIWGAITHIAAPH